MKKILALLLVLVMVFALAACGGEDTTSSKADKVDTSSAVTGGVDDGELNADDLDDDDEETSSAAEKTLELKEDIQYVVVALKSKRITISSTDDFADYTCAYVSDCDSEVWANYYTFKNDTEGTGMYMEVNDLRSGLRGNNFDIGIVAEIGANAYDDWEIIWTLKAE